MQNINEKVLDAWLRLSTTICNERIVSDMPYNETLICNTLYQSAKRYPEKKLTATELCTKLKMLKSQMNRTLNHMEEKGLIFRERSALDKRQVYVGLNMENIGTYKRQHEKILNFVGSLLEKMGKEKAEDIIKLFTLISDTADEVME